MKFKKRPAELTNIHSYTSFALWHHTSKIHIHCGFGNLGPFSTAIAGLVLQNDFDDAQTVFYTSR